MEGFTGNTRQIEARLSEIAAEGWVLVTAGHNTVLGHMVRVFQRADHEG